MMSRLALLEPAEWLLLGGMLGVIAFTLLYGLRSRWWKYIEGVALFFKSFTLALVSALSVAYLVWGEYPYRQTIRTIVYALFFAGSWFFVFALLRRQNREARRRKPLERELKAAREREGDTSDHRTPFEVFHDWRHRNR